MTAGPPGAGDEDRGKRAGDLRPVGGAIREKGGLLNPDSRPQDGEDGQERAPGGGALLADACPDIDGYLNAAIVIGRAR